ncbi:MAG: hypothetical protein EKK55_08795 [Rhodocyclaceae bacterium]|nr:MAG: hypothetical protein EKK55_08795 [Rhodocyclaceae bacterium]
MTISVSVFRRRRAGKVNRRWTIQLRHADGRVEQRLAYTDRAASQQLAARLQREAERREVGLHDKFGEARRTPLQQHVDDFLLAMQNGTLARGRRGRPTTAYVERARRRLTMLFDELAATRIEQLRQHDVEQVLQRHVAAGWSDMTRDHHAAILRQFGAWLVDDQRAAANPFHRLRPVRTEASKTFRRHALTLDELQRLVEAAQVRGRQVYAQMDPWATPEHLAEIEAKGAERAVFFQVAAFTGLRRGELTALVWDDLQLGPQPAIEVRATTTKNRRRARLEIPAWLGEVLAQHRAACAKALGGLPAATSPVFARLSYRHVTEQMRLDAVFARIGRLDTVSGRQRVVTDAGAVVDVHSLRGTLATLAAQAGMPVKLLQEHLRHQDIRLTMQVYAKLPAGAMRAAIDALPAPMPARDTPRSAETGQPMPADKNAQETGT